MNPENMILNLKKISKLDERTFHIVNDLFIEFRQFREIHGTGLSHSKLNEKWSKNTAFLTLLGHDLLLDSTKLSRKKNLKKILKSSKKTEEKGKQFVGVKTSKKKGVTKSK